MIDLLFIRGIYIYFDTALAGTLVITLGAYFYGRYQEECKRIEHNVSFYFLDRNNNVKGPKNILALMDYPTNTQIWNESQQKWMKISELPNYTELRKMRIHLWLTILICVIGFTGVITGIFLDRYVFINPIVFAF